MARITEIVSLKANIADVYSKTEIDDSFGDLSTLSTTEQGSLVGAINEIDDSFGDLSTLSTTEQGSLVGAINEIDINVNNIESKGISYNYYDEIIITADNITNEDLIYNITDNNSEITDDITSNLRIYKNGMKLRNSQISFTYNKNISNSLTLSTIDLINEGDVLEIEKTIFN